jgi:LysR family transcriptional regulator, glycine cleavage system transcriptional activator
MARPRRFLPSISLIAAFEAVLRTGSTTAAARDLNLTQATVSRLIQSLEGQLGRPLFLRHKQRLIPTAAARAYGQDMTRALDLIERASLSIVANPDGGALALSILPAFGARWLGPRLPRFLDAHPGVTLNLSTRLRRFSFDGESFDAAISFGRPDWPGADHLHLMDERLTACAAPALLARQPVATPADLGALPLLQLDARRAGWGAWFAAHGLNVPPIRGMQFDQFSMMTQAAIAGLGVALLPSYLAQVEIAEGRLRPLFTPDVTGTGAYWLVWPEARADYPPLVALRDWLRAEVA